MNRRKRAYRWIYAVIFALSISTVAGQLAPVRAETESERFFDQGEQKLEQEAEILEESQNPNDKPLLTIDESSSPAEVGSPEESEAETPQPKEAAIENMEERRGQQEQELEQELNIDERDSEEPKVKYVPSPEEEEGLDDNEPFQPAEAEAEVKF